jgi:hypothetical protein
VCGALGSSRVYANGLLEIVGGQSWATGGELENQQNWGGQITLGWGGRSQSMNEGSAMYGYGAVSADQLRQIGPVDLGKPKLNRDQIGLTGGARWYQQIGERSRLWLDLGMGYAFDSSTTSIVGLSDSHLNTQSFIFTTALGLQYKIEAKLLFSLGYYQSFYTERGKMGLPERPLISDRQNHSFGRGRLAIGLGWHL